MSSNTPQVEPEGVAAKLQFLATEHWSLLATVTGTSSFTPSWNPIS
jgi:hypothetical protein